MCSITKDGVVLINSEFLYSVVACLADCLEGTERKH
jgi:hypothetical protein